MNSRLLDYRPDLDFLDAAPRPQPRRDRPADTDLRRAAELLEVADHAELEQFLRGLVAQASRAGRAALDAPGAPALLAALKRVAQFALPLPRAGGPLVDALGGSGGSANAPARGARIFGLELEGLSPEDQEFELAQHFVRFAADAVRRADAAGIAAGGGAAPQAVQAALAQAARHHAPGLLRRAAASGGRWQRHGDSIIVHDC